MASCDERRRARKQVRNVNRTNEKCGNQVGIEAFGGGSGRFWRVKDKGIAPREECLIYFLGTDGASDKNCSVRTRRDVIIKIIIRQRSGHTPWRYHKNINHYYTTTLLLLLSIILYNDVSTRQTILIRRIARLNVSMRKKNILLILIINNTIRCAREWIHIVFIDKLRPRIDSRSWLTQ